MSIEQKWANEYGFDDRRSCDHCSRFIAPDQPLLRLEGCDDRICEDCMNKFYEEATEAPKIDLGRSIKDAIDTVDEVLKKNAEYLDLSRKEDK